jgi:hypothetical protein
MVQQTQNIAPKVETEVLFDPFPKQQEFINAALSGDYGFILYGGAIRGGKTFSLLALFILLCKIYPRSRWAIVRKDLPVIKSNLLPSWEKIRPNNFIKTPNSDYNQQTTTFKNGSQLIFFPETYKTDKDQNRWRGLEVNGFGFEELNECQAVSLGKAFERAGTYIIKDAKVQPKPLVVATCNPTQGWVKPKVYTPWKTGQLQSNWLYIPSRIYDNEPLLQAQPDLIKSYKANMTQYEWEVYVEGNWDVALKTGGEFLRDFEIGTHVKPVIYTPGVPVCISLDSNVYPYIAITCWQLIRKGEGWIIRQIDELPASDPENTANKAGSKIARWLHSLGQRQRVMLYGDYSLKERNNIDEKKRSFFQIVEETIRVQGNETDDKMMPHVPVASAGDFINAIFRGEIPNVEIEIGENCKVSINDYIQTKTDKDGSMLKEKQAATPLIPAHEKNGHLTDTLKDFIVQSFNKEYQQWLNGKKNNIGNFSAMFG